MRTSENVLTNFDKRLLYISDEIDNSSMGKACFDILFINKADDEQENTVKDFVRKPICVYINSGGGLVRDSWGLIDIIEKSKTPVHTYCTGYAMSAALNIFLSGHKRFAYRHSTFLYHPLYSWIQGKYRDLVDETKELDVQNKQVEDYVIERTKITQEYLDNIREKKIEMYIRPEEALELGIVDEIL